MPSYILRYLWSAQPGVRAPLKPTSLAPKTSQKVEEDIPRPQDTNWGRAVRRRSITPDQQQNYHILIVRPTYKYVHSRVPLVEKGLIMDAIRVRVKDNEWLKPL